MESQNQRQFEVQLPLQFTATKTKGFPSELLSPWRTKTICRGVIASTRCPPSSSVCRVLFSAAKWETPRSHRGFGCTVSSSGVVKSLQGAFANQTLDCNSIHVHDQRHRHLIIEGPLTMFSESFDPFGFEHPLYYGNPQSTPYEKQKRRESAHRQRTYEAERRRKLEAERRRRVTDKLFMDEYRREFEWQQHEVLLLDDTLGGNSNNNGTTPKLRRHTSVDVLVDHDCELLDNTNHSLNEESLTQLSASTYPPRTIVLRKTDSRLHTIVTTTTENNNDYAHRGRSDTDLSTILTDYEHGTPVKEGKLSEDEDNTDCCSGRRRSDSDVSSIVTEYDSPENEASNECPKESLDCCPMRRAVTDSSSIITEYHPRCSDAKENRGSLNSKNRTLPSSPNNRCNSKSDLNCQSRPSSTNQEPNDEYQDEESVSPPPHISAMENDESDDEDEDLWSLYSIWKKSASFVSPLSQS